MGGEAAAALPAATAAAAEAESGAFCDVSGCIM